MEPGKTSVLMLGWGYPPEIEGGLDIHVAEVFEQLLELGVDVRLALPRENCPEGEKFIALEPGKGDMVERARKMSSQFVEHAREFDVVHTHDWFGAEAGLKAKRHADCAWVSTLHSIGADRSRSPSERIRRLEKASVEAPDVVTTVSSRLANRIEDEYGRRPEVVRNGLSRPKSSGMDVREHHGIGGDEKLVLYVGRLAEQKSVELLVRAMDGLDAHLLVAGTGRRRESLEQLAEILGVRNQVHFAGFVDDKVLGDYYRAADVFASPSKNEPFGLTITEALVSGTPVVSTGSGAEELVESGSVSAGKRSESIREKLGEVLESPPEISYRDRTWKDVAEDYRKLYARLSRSSTDSTVPG